MILFTACVAMQGTLRSYRTLNTNLYFYYYLHNVPLVHYEREEIK